MVVLRHRRVLRRRPEILPDGEDRHPDAAQVVEHRQHFVGLFAEADHDAGLRRDVGPVVPGSVEQLERAGVLSPGPRHAVQTGNRLDVVVQHVGPGVEDRAQRRFHPLEVRDQDLDAAVRYAFPCAADRVGEDAGAAVSQVIAIHGRDDGILQAHALHRFGDARRLRRVELVRPPVRHRAVCARSRADVAEDHEGSGPVVPALADVGTARILADRVELEVLHDALEPEVVLRPGGAYLQPCRLRFTRAHEFERGFDGHFI